MALYGVQAPMPQWVGGTRKWAYGHFNRRLTAVVIHRMDGSLEGSDGWLRREFDSNGNRLNASTHFGVGLWNGVPQIRQWVDTAHTAFGWAARPTDTPTALARTTLTNLWSGTEDLNWQVICVEVEGWSTQPWDNATKLKVKELLAWIYRTHGNLTIMAHTDCSWKPCPGMATFQAALPGYYGNKLANVVGGVLVPNTSTAAPTITSSLTRVGGLPVDFKPRTGTAVIRPGKPRRAGATLASKNYGSTGAGGAAFRVWGQVRGQSIDGKSTWFFGPQYLQSEWRIVYVPIIDLKDIKFN